MRRVRHTTRGTTYEVLGEGAVQISGPPPEFVPSRLISWSGQMPIKDGDRLTVYRCEQTGKLYLRFPHEFEDGRFEDV